MSVARQTLNLVPVPIRVRPRKMGPLGIEPSPAGYESAAQTLELQALTVGSDRFELSISRLSSVRFNQLSYEPHSFGNRISGAYFRR